MCVFYSKTWTKSWFNYWYFLLNFDWVENKPNFWTVFSHKKPIGKKVEFNFSILLEFVFFPMTDNHLRNCIWLKATIFFFMSHFCECVCVNSCLAWNLSQSVCHTHAHKYFFSFMTLRERVNVCVEHNSFIAIKIPIFVQNSMTFCPTQLLDNRGGGRGVGMENIPRCFTLKANCVILCKVIP